MTDAFLSFLVRLLLRPCSIWIVFVVVHSVLAIIAFQKMAVGLPLGDVTLVYQPWAYSATHGVVLGIDLPWVYPIVAMVPLAIAGIFGSGDSYLVAWIVLVTCVNGAGLWVLLWGHRVRHIIAAWWWLGFTALLGPIAIGRIDALTVPLAVIALLWLGRRPAVAAFLLTLAMWIKVWPAALITTLVVAYRRRLIVGATVLVTSALIIAISLVLGSEARVFGFIGEQTGRGLQVEAPISTFWMWCAAFTIPGNFVYYDRSILTFQVAGPGVDVTAWLMTPLLAIVIAGIIMCGVRAVRHGVRFTHLAPWLALSLVMSLIVFNKVGSPQFVGWLVAPIVFGIVCIGEKFRFPAVLGLCIATLTQLIYPYLYSYFLAAYPVMVAIVSLRNVCELVVLIFAVNRLWKTGHSFGSRRMGQTPRMRQTPDSHRMQQTPQMRG